GEIIPSELVVWCAGVKAPAFLADIGGLETNHINQLVVRPTLQATRDDDVFAIGDCASCPREGFPQPVPPRAQGERRRDVLRRHVAELSVLHAGLHRQPRTAGMPNSASSNYRLGSFYSLVTAFLLATQEPFSFLAASSLTTLQFVLLTQIALMISI